VNKLWLGTYKNIVPVNIVIHMTLCQRGKINVDCS